jgi:hypothetical protein
MGSSFAMGTSGGEALFIRLTEPLRAMWPPTSDPSSVYGYGTKFSLSEKPAFLNTESAAEPTGGCLVFGRKKREKDNIGVSCPYCEYNNPLGAETCEQCYYDLNKSARDQPMAEPTTSGDEIMSLLLGENEEAEEPIQVVEAVLSMDDVTVDVGQYDLPEPIQDEEGETVPESFDFIGSQGPTLSKTVAAQDEEEDVELTVDDAPKEYIAFELGDVNPLDEVAEPVHTGKGGLYSPTVETPNDDDLLGEIGPSTTSATPELPDLPDDDEPVQAGASLAQAVVAEPQTPAPDVAIPASETTAPAVAPSSTVTPDLPDLPDDEPEQEPPATNVQDTSEEAQEIVNDDRIWPWPKAEPWTPTQVYQEVVAAMEHVKHNRMEDAANTLDALGPHLDLNLDMLLHISVLMQHLGRHDHVKWTLDMAAYVHPTDAHVQQARAQLLA